MSRPRPRKSEAHVRAARIRAALTRWRKLSAEERNQATAPARAEAMKAKLLLAGSSAKP